MKPTPVVQRHLSSAESTRAAGHAFGAGLAMHGFQQPLLIALSGELGAGKTTFVGGLLTAFGHVGTVRSPTYTLIEPYAFAGRDVYHLDLYRLRDPSELEELGLRDLMQPGAIVLVEWPERAGGELGSPDVHVRLDYPNTGHDGRVLHLHAMTESGKRLVDSVTF